MFLKFVEHVHKVENLKFGIHKGIVITNGDPEKLGRVKCKILGLLEEDNPNNLIWCYPRIPENAPSGQSINVPEKGAEVAICFPFNDIYFPEYIGYWVSEKNAPAKKEPSLFDDNYPNTYGAIDSVKNYWRINKSKKFIEAKSSGGTKIKIENNGNVTIDNPKNISVNNGGDLTFDVRGNSKIKSGGTTTIESSKEISISSLAAKISISTVNDVNVSALNASVTATSIKLGGEAAIAPCLTGLTPCLVLGFPHSAGSSVVKCTP
jgi:hypothetical protein